MYLHVILWLIIIFLSLVSLYILIWQVHLLIAAIFGAPVVATNKMALKDAFDLAELKPGQCVVDLGCGSAKALIFASKKYGAKGIGIERSPLFYVLSKINVWLSGQSKNIIIIFADIDKAKKYIKKANVVYLYLIPATMKQIEEWLFQSISHDTRIISLSFSFPSHQPIKTVDTRQLWQTTKIRLYQK